MGAQIFKGLVIEMSFVPGLKLFCYLSECFIVWMMFGNFVNASGKWRGFVYHWSMYDQVRTRDLSEEYLETP